MSYRGGKKGGGKQNRYAPAASAPPQNYIHRVTEYDNYVYKFLRAFPDDELNCIRDYGHGQERLSRKHISDTTSARTASPASDLRGRMEFRLLELVHCP